MVEATGFAWGRRSRMHSDGLDPSWRIFLADSVGELRWWWGMADLGFVGGSFGARGGQNMIEPCAMASRLATAQTPETLPTLSRSSMRPKRPVSLQVPRSSSHGWWECSRTSRCEPVMLAGPYRSLKSIVERPTGPGANSLAC